MNMREVFLCILVALLFGLNAKSLFTDPDWAGLASGFASSVLAAVFAVFFVTWRDSQKLTKIQEQLTKIQEQLGDLSKADRTGRHFVRINRNSDLGKEYWPEIIGHLDTSPEAAYLLGNRLYRWRSNSDYRDPLCRKLVARVCKISGNSESEAWCTYIGVTDQQAFTDWDSFLRNNVITKISAEQRRVCNGATRLYLFQLPKHRLFYSPVICGTKIV
ncbi:MAG: hypothetical protein MN733_06540, partial [Nitrososphaera sp.]|nr:hypothetical protein [Nitrososphaera sp.]